MADQHPVYPLPPPSTPPPPPPPPPSAAALVHHHNHGADGHADHQGFFTPSTIILIALPIFVFVVVAIVAFSLLIVLCRARTRQPASSIKSCDAGIRKNNLDQRSVTSNSNAIGYGSDVSSCISGSTLGCQLQARNRRGQVFTYKELELATNGFGEDNVIGHGGFGVVYRGILSDGTVAAIKLLHMEGKQGEREFRLEVDLLSRLHSAYLVGLLGYCADQHHRLLVFEYMSYGSLQHHLHATSKDQKYRPLDWGRRMRIALDCARGLEFLHERTVPAIIHRDFKSSNILLDHNYRAKVSDFGMAKIASDKINGQVLTRVLGTSGYVAPEYASTGKLTTKSDVYSYGVVLLQLLTGRLPVDTTRPPGECFLVPWALPRLTNSDKVVEMVDPALQGHYSKKELVQVAAIAAVCVQAEAEYRPLMTDIVQSLMPLVKNQGHSPYSVLHHQVSYL